MNTENKYLSGFQWFVYLLANSIALPIVIGNVFQLTATEISALMQRTFLSSGLVRLCRRNSAIDFPLQMGQPVLG